MNSLLHVEAPNLSLRASNRWLIFCLPGELGWTVGSNLLKFWTGMTAMVHCKIIAPSSLSQSSREYIVFFSFKTYGPNYFQLKRKAWNKPNVWFCGPDWNRFFKKIVCKVSTSMCTQPSLEYTFKYLPRASF